MSLLYAYVPYSRTRFPCVYFCLLSWVDQHSSLLPVRSSSRPSLPPRITRQICKNTLLISRQKWQPPPMTSAPRIPFFPPRFSFSFFISCSAPETQILAHCSPSVLPTLFPPTYVATPTCQLCTHPHTHTQTHTNTVYICTVTDIDRDSISNHVILWGEYIRKQQTCLTTQTQVHLNLLQCLCYLTQNHSEIETCWSSCLQITKKKNGSPFSLLYSILSSPHRLQLFIESVFSGLDSLLHPGTLRALCDSGDKEVAVTKVSKHTQCHRHSVLCNPFRKYTSDRSQPFQCFFFFLQVMHL